MINNKLLCYSTIGILFVLIFMIGIKVFKNKTIIEENFYDGETQTQDPAQEDLKAQIDLIKNQINTIIDKNQKQDTALTEKQNKLTDDQESKLKSFENINLKDLEITNQNIDLYKNALLETDKLRKIKDQEQLKAIEANEESVKNMKDSMIQISNTESNLDKIIKELGVFHNDYQNQLENILQKRLSVNDAEFKLKKDNLNKLINQLSDKMENIQSAIKDEVINQIVNRQVSTRLVVERMPQTTDIYKIFVNTPPPDNDPGCLSFEDNEASGEICADLTNQQYTLEKIKDENTYLNKIRSSSSTADPVSVNKNIRYPFYLVKPISNPLKFLVCNIDKGITKLSFKKLSGNMNERFDGFTQIDADLNNCNM